MDLHVHTVYSDGFGTVEEVLEKAKSKGLNGLAVTDHGTLEGYFKAKLGGKDLLILPGYEVKTDVGHILVLGLEQLPYEIKPLLYENLIGWARSRGGLTVLVHPAAGRIRFEKWMYCKPDAVEVLNASYPLKCFIRRGLEIASRLNVPSLGGSDAHYSQNVGDAYTIVEINGNPDENAIVEAIRKGKARFAGELSPFKTRLRIGLSYLFTRHF